MVQLIINVPFTSALHTDPKPSEQLLETPPMDGLITYLNICGESAPNTFKYNLLNIYKFRPEALLKNQIAITKHKEQSSSLDYLFSHCPPSGSPIHFLHLRTRTVFLQLNTTCPHDNMSKHTFIKKYVHSISTEIKLKHKAPLEDSRLHNNNLLKVLIVRQFILCVSNCDWWNYCKVISTY